MSTKSEWDAIEKKVATSRNTRTYASAECLICGRLIKEGCYSGRNGNYKRHMATHEAKADHDQH